MRNLFCSIMFLLPVYAFACSGSGGSDETAKQELPVSAPVKTYILANCYLDPAFPSSGEIYLITGGSFGQLVPDGFFPENVDISSDGSMIAYSKGENENSEIYVMDIASGRETRVTDNSFPDYNPNLSPDKKEVVYWSSRSNETRLYISDAGGLNERCITCGFDAWTYDPEWSHDGTMIAFNYDVTKTGCKAVIYAGILDGGHTGFEAIFPVSNTAGAYVEVDPAWSSDDSRIAFSSYEGPGCWFAEGLQSANLNHWKLKTVTIDRTGRQGTDLKTVWQSPGTHVDWLPIWAEDDKSLLVIHSVIDASPYTPFGTTSYLAYVDIETSAEAKVPGTDGCYWCDYLKK